MLESQANGSSSSLAAMKFPTSTMQRYYYLRNTNKMYCNFLVGARYHFIIPDHQEISAEGQAELTTTNIRSILYPALQKLIANNLLLASTVIGDGQNITLATSFCAADIVTFESIPELNNNNDKSKNDAILEKIMNNLNQIQIPYTCDKPMWRLHIVNESYIFVYMDHLFFDGMSGANFHKELYIYLNGEIQNSSSNNGKNNVNVNDSIILFDTNTADVSKIQNQLGYSSIEHVQKMDLTWKDTTSFMASKLLSKSLYTFCATLYNSVMGDTTTTQLSAEIDKRFSKSDEDSSFSFLSHWNTNGKKATYPTTTSNNNTPYPVCTIRLGEFDSNMKLIRISPTNMSKLKLYMKKMNIRFSSLFAYIIMLSILPLTARTAVRCDIPTNVRAFAKEQYLVQNQNGSSPEMLFGNIIGSLSIELQSLLNVAPGLCNDDEFNKQLSKQNPDTTQPEIIGHIIASKIKHLLTSPTQQQQHSDLPNPLLFNVECLQFIDRLFKAIQENKTSSLHGGCFAGWGLLALGEQLMGLDAVIADMQRETSCRTFELSNLGVHSFSTTSANAKSDKVVNIDDLFFSQKGLCPGHYFTANIAGVHNGDVNIMFDAIAFFSPEQFKIITDLLIEIIEKC